MQAALERRWMILSAASAVAVGACIVTKPPAAPGASLIRYPTRQLELLDGLRIVLETAPDVGIAAAVLVVGAGGADESAAQAGLAHLTEHLAFKATHAGVSFMDRRRNGGLEANARTSWDATTFYAADDVRSLAELLIFLDGTVRRPLAGIDEQLFARELLTVGNERRMRTEAGTPGQAAGWLMTASFPAGHAYAHPLAGSSDSLAHLKFADVRAFAAAHYRPETSTLVVSAPLPLDAQQELVERITGQRAVAGPSSHADPRRGAAPPRAPPRSFEVRYAEVPTPMLWIGWPVPSATGDSSDLATLAAAVIENSFLADLARRDPDIASLEAGCFGGTAASLLYVTVALKEAKHPEETARRVADVASAMLPHLEALKRVTSTRQVYGEENIVSRALTLAWSAHHLADATFYRSVATRMMSRSADELQSYTKTFLGAERAHVVLVRPAVDPAPPPVPVQKSAAPRVLAAISSSAAPGPVLLRAAISSPPLPPHAQLAKLETHELSNGLTVILLPRPGSQFHTVLLGFTGGHAQGAPPGVATAASWSRQREGWAPQVWGLDYQYRIRADTTLEVLRATGSDVRFTIKELASLLRHSTFWPPRRFNEAVEVLEREDRAPPAALERALSHAVFGDNPLGARPSAKEIQKITPAEVLRWIDRVRRPSNAALVIVGDFDVQVALAAVQAELGSWGGNARREPRLPDPPAVEQLASGQMQGERLLVQHRPGALQAKLRLSCLLPRGTAETAGARMMFRDIVERSLFGDLREEMGASYVVNSQISLLVGGTAMFDLTADLDYARVAGSLTRVRDLLTRAGAPFADETSFRRARAMTSRPWRADSREMAISLLDLWKLGWPLDLLDRLPAQAAASPLGEVVAVAEHCRDNAVIGLLGDERLLREAAAHASP